MTTQVTEGARQERLPPSFLASRGPAARASALPSLNLKNNRDCSQSKENITNYSTTHKSLVMM